MKAEIERAEQEADITIIMPQMGVEYRLEPTEEQKVLYHKMIDWGGYYLWRASSLVEPSETVEKDGDKKLIIYSMGNFIPINELKPCKMKRMLSGQSVACSWM